MPASRLLPSDEAVDLIALVRDLATNELAPLVARAEREEEFPREVFRLLGRAGLLGLPYPEEYGGGGLPYEVYLQVLEELGSVWASVGVGVSVHALSCFGLATAGTAEQKRRWLPDMLGGKLLGAYALSEPHAVADGLVADPPEQKMGLTGSATATLRLDGVRIPVERRLGAEGEGLKIALAGLDAGRLGIAAVATGLAQGALDHAVAYAKSRETFGERIIDHQGLSFVLADMEAAIESARATMLHAARLKDQGLPYGREASVAKLVATDNAMRVTTDAVQVLGGYGYTRDFPVERYMREA